MSLSKKGIYFSLLMLGITAFYGTNYYFSNMHVNDFSVFVVSLLSVVVLLLSRTVTIRTPYKLVVALSFIMCISGVIIASAYSIPTASIFKEGCYTVTPILVYYAYRGKIKKSDDLYLFLKHLCAAALICNVTSILAFFLSFSGIDLLNINIFARQRNGTVRFIIGEVVLVTGLFISIGGFVDKQTKRMARRFYLINILLTLFNLFFIAKTRTLTFYIMATMFVLPVMSKDVKKSRKVLFGLLALIILVVAVTSDFIPYMSSIFSSDYGIQMRFSEIEYYWKYFTEHFLFGAGYATSAPIFPTGTLGSGPSGRYYTSDVGIIGLLFKSGLIGLIWLLSWFKTSYSLLMHNIEGMPKHYEILIKSLGLFLVMSCINLIVTDDPRFAYIPIFMILSESSRYVCDKSKVLKTC